MAEDGVVLRTGKQMMKGPYYLLIMYIVAGLVYLLLLAASKPSAPPSTSSIILSVLVYLFFIAIAMFCIYRAIYNFVFRIQIDREGIRIKLFSLKREMRDRRYPWSRVSHIVTRGEGEQRLACIIEIESVGRIPLADLQNVEKVLPFIESFVDQDMFVDVQTLMPDISCEGGFLG